MLFKNNRWLLLACCLLMLLLLTQVLVPESTQAGSVAMETGSNPFPAAAPSKVTTGSRPYSPTNLKATVSGNQVALVWVDNSNNESSFKIYRKPYSIAVFAGGSEFSPIATIPANVTHYIDTIPVGLYIYRVWAYNSSGASDFYSETNATIMPPQTTASVTQQLPVTPQQKAAAMNQLQDNIKKQQAMIEESRKSMLRKQFEIWNSYIRN